MGRKQNDKNKGASSPSCQTQVSQRRTRAKSSQQQNEEPLSSKLEDSQKDLKNTDETDNLSTTSDDSTQFSEATIDETEENKYPKECPPAKKSFLVIFSHNTMFIQILRKKYRH